MNKIISLTIIMAALSACAGVDVARDPITGYQSINQWERQAFGTNTDFIHYSRCDRDYDAIKEINDAGRDPLYYTVDYEGTNCVPIASYHNGTSGTVNQLAMPAAVVGGAIAIKSGLSGSGDNVVNSNSQGQISINRNINATINGGRR